MEITKEYILSRVEAKLKERHKHNWENILNLFNQLNVEIASHKGLTIDDSVVGWAVFCSTVEKMIESRQTLDVESFEKLFLSTGKPKGLIQSSHVTDPDYVPVEQITNPDEFVQMAYEKASSLLSSNVFEEESILEDINPEDLSVEGWRARGFIGASDTELDGNELKPNMDGVTVVYEESFRNPFTPGGLAMQLTSALWIDIETEKQFYYYRKPETATDEKATPHLPA